MQNQAAFETVSLQEIQHLMSGAEYSEADVAACVDCGHPLIDHSIDNDTCWFALQADGAVKLCNCLGYRVCA